MVTRTLIAVGALLLLGACELPGSVSGCHAQIDWVNFIQVGSTRYIAGPEATTVLQESDLGEVVAKVKFKVSGNVCDPGYKVKDGDAAFLDVGTPIYLVKGHAQGDQLASRFNGGILVYRAMH